MRTDDPLPRPGFHAVRSRIPSLFLLYHRRIILEWWKFDQLTPWSWVLLDKPPIAQLLKMLPFYETRRFITMFTRTDFYPEPDQSSPYHSILSLRSIFKLSTPPPTSWYSYWSLWFKFGIYSNSETDSFYSPCTFFQRSLGYVNKKCLTLKCVFLTANWTASGSWVWCELL
jgi:hypothetical protein